MSETKFKVYRFTHLQHIPYTISLQVNNDSGAQRLGMVRIFLSPKTDERGQAWLFRDQRGMMIELDKFVTACECHWCSGLASVQAFVSNSSATWSKHLETTFNRIDCYDSL